MAKKQYTKGCWVYGPDPEEPDADHKSVHVGDDNFIARIDWCEEQDANGHLIAAAPAMLEALKRCLNFIENTESEIGETLESGDMARSAIAKAEATNIVEKLENQDTRK